jgi:hypothetical protein
MSARVEKYLFMAAVLRLLERRGFVLRVAATMLRVSAFLIVLGSLASFFTAGKVVFGLPANGMMGGVLFLVFYILAIYAVAHAILLRARSIEAIESDRFFMLALSAMLVRLAGEVYAAYAMLTAIGGGLFVWFTGERVGKILSPMPLWLRAGQKPDFMGGIELILTGVLMSVAVLILSYAVAELIGAILRLLDREPGEEAAPRAVNGDYRARSRFG